jgi:hypothetical protein
MKPFLWLFAVLALEVLIYAVVFHFWGLTGMLFLAAFDFALLALVQHHRFTSIPS